MDMEILNHHSIDSHFIFDMKGLKKSDVSKEFTNRYVELTYMRAISGISKGKVTKTFSAPGRRPIKKELTGVKSVNNNSKYDAYINNDATTKVKDEPFYQNVQQPKNVALSNVTRTEQFRQSEKTTADNTKSRVNGKLKLRSTRSHPVGKLRTSNGLQASYGQKGLSNDKEIVSYTELLDDDSQTAKSYRSNLSRLGLTRHSVPDYRVSCNGNFICYVNNTTETNKNTETDDTTSPDSLRSCHDVNPVDYKNEPRSPDVESPVSRYNPLAFSNDGNVITITDENHPYPRVRIESISLDVEEFSRTIISQPGSARNGELSAYQKQIRTRYQTEVEKDQCLECLYQAKNFVRCCTCMWCLDAACYHCTKDDIGYSSNWSENLVCDHEQGSNWCKLTAFGLASLLLPCLWFYPAANACLSACSRCRKQQIRDPSH